tara:strand:- start:175 stop:423 length:249 start_codon:yes stop_codon:yes gene_type:complete
MPHFNGSKQGKAKPVKKVKQIDINEKRDLSGGYVDHNVITKMQYNVPKGVADDKQVKPAQVFEGYKKTNNKSNKSNKSKSNK